MRNLFLTRQLMCSEAVLTVLNKSLKGDLGTEMAVRLASGFPEGMASGCTCGSLVGGVMAVGLFCGRRRPGIGNGGRVTAAARKLHDLFKDKFGSTCCRVLTKHVRWGSDDHYQSCSRMAGFAAETAARLILQERPELADGADRTYLEKSDSRRMGRLRQVKHLLLR